MELHLFLNVQEDIREPNRVPQILPAEALRQFGLQLLNDHHIMNVRIHNELRINNMVTYSLQEPMNSSFIQEQSGISVMSDITNRMVQDMEIGMPITHDAVFAVMNSRLRYIQAVNNKVAQMLEEIDRINTRMENEIRYNIMTRRVLRADALIESDTNIDELCQNLHARVKARFNIIIWLDQNINTAKTLQMFLQVNMEAVERVRGTVRIRETVETEDTIDTLETVAT